MSILGKIRRRLGRKPREDWRDEVPAAVLRRIKPGSAISIVDLGANQGDFTRALSMQYRITGGLLVEALPGLAEKLRAEFKAPVYRVEQCAVSDRAGVVSFQKNETEATSSLLKIKRDHAAFAGVPLEAETFEVRTRTLDELAGEAGLAGIDLLKIDVQGAEDKVLAGAPGTLAQTRAVLVEISFKPLYEGSAVFWDIYRMMDTNFRLVDVIPGFRAPDGELLQADLLFVHR